MKREIWIVEDDAGIAEITSLILTDNGYSPIIINTIEELFEKLKTRKPDLILLDIFLYNANGIDITRKLKNDIQMKTIPIIIMSADTQIEQKAKDVGADDFLKKPFELKIFLEKLEQNLKKQDN